jgi:hypothetical protein
LGLVEGLLRFKRSIPETPPVITIHLQTRRLSACPRNQTLGHHATGTRQLCDTLALAA